MPRRRGRRRDEPEPPAEYVRQDLRPGNKIKCAGCDKEHTLKEDRNEEGEVCWSFSDVCEVHLAKAAPVSAWVCETGHFSPSLRCYTRALNRMGRCPGCGLGPRDPDPGDPDKKVGRYQNAGEIPHGSICSRCEKAVEAGYAVLAKREDVTWRQLDTQALFDLAAFHEEGNVPEEAFDALREAAHLIAQLAAAPDHQAVKTRYGAGLGWGSEDLPTIPAEIGSHVSSDEPLAEVGDVTAGMVELLGEAIGRAVALAQAGSKREGESILKALARCNTATNPYEGLLGADETQGDD